MCRVIRTLATIRSSASAPAVVGFASRSKRFSARRLTVTQPDRRMIGNQRQTGLFPFGRTKRASDKRYFASEYGGRGDSICPIQCNQIAIDEQKCDRLKRLAIRPTFVSLAATMCQMHNFAPSFQRSDRCNALRMHSSNRFTFVQEYFREQFETYSHLFGPLSCLR